jgi:hypothetical protein
MESDLSKFSLSEGPAVTAVMLCIRARLLVGPYRPKMGPVRKRTIEHAKAYVEAE